MPFMRRLTPARRRSCVRAALRATLATAAALLASEARAQSPEDRRAAAALFIEAREQMAEGRFDDACPRLARSNLLDPGVGTQLNLAHCYELLGRTASAWSTWRAAADAAGAMKAVDQDEADRRRQADREAFARARITDLESRLLYVTLRVADAGNPPPSVTLDGQGVPPERWGVETPVDPGVHVVAAQAPGRKPWVAQFEVAEQRAPRVDLVVPPLEAIPLVQQEPARGPTNGRDWMRPAAIGAGAFGLAMGAIGTGFGLAAIGAHDRAANDCAHASSCTDQRTRDLHQLDVDSTASDITLAAAGAGIVAAAIFWFAAPAHPGSDRLAVQPLFGPREAALTLSERW
jgi:serine/threonine-protein kinase